MGGSPAGRRDGLCAVSLRGWQAAGAPPCTAGRGWYLSWVRCPGGKSSIPSAKNLREVSRCLVPSMVLFKQFTGFQVSLFFFLWAAPPAHTCLLSPVSVFRRDVQNLGQTDHNFKLKGCACPEACTQQCS